MFQGRWGKHLYNNLHIEKTSNFLFNIITDVYINRNNLQQIHTQRNDWRIERQTKTKTQITETTCPQTRKLLLTFCIDLLSYTATQQQRIQESYRAPQHGHKFITNVDLIQPYQQKICDYLLNQTRHKKRSSLQTPTITSLDPPILHLCQLLRPNTSDDSNSLGDNDIVTTIITNPWDQFSHQDHHYLSHQFGRYGIVILLILQDPVIDTYLRPDYTPLSHQVRNDLSNTTMRN